MLYSKDDVLAAVRDELAEANRNLGIADGFTGDDYEYLGVIAAAWERLLARQPNGSKPHVSGSLLPPDKIWLLKEIAHPYIYETAEEGTYSIAIQGIEKILEYYEHLRQQ